MDLVYHIPALLPQALESLALKPGGTYVDCTFGGGGHSRAIVEALGTEGHLYAFDQDLDAIDRAFSDPRFTIVHGNFRFMANFLRYYNVDKVDGILADLGVSFHHFDDPDRGFSFRFDGPLDMRMNRNARLSAADIVARYSEQQLADMLYIYGELKNSRKLASLIVKRRAQGAITTTEQLIEAVNPQLNPRDRKTDLAKIFQALRIEVNHELDALKDLLTACTRTLRPGGRLVIITYHSLEDRLVKNFMRTGNLQGTEAKDFFGRNLSPFRLVTSKPIVPDAAEIEANPRSRSAKMRVAELLPSKQS